MASQPVVGVQLEYYKISSFIRGVHAYQLYWQSNAHTVQLLKLQGEPQNTHDRHAVAIVTADGTTVGHIPFNLAPVISSLSQGTSIKALWNHQ